MKRFAAAVGIVVGLAAAVFLIFFTASRHRVEGQSYFQSLSDFAFMVGTYNAQALGLTPPPLTDRSYRRVMSHTRSTSHNEVDRRVVWSLVRWGEAVAPRLIEEIVSSTSSARTAAAARALAELHHEPALPALEDALVRARSDRRREVDLIEALGRFGPEAAPMLIDAYQWHARSELGAPYNLLDAIGRTQGGTDFLLAEMESAEREGSTERILSLEWPLAFSRDPRAARKLVSLLHHSTLRVRRRARDSMSQSMGSVAVEPAVDLLEKETDDYVRMWIIETILASENAADSTRAVELLGRLLEDPILGGRANYALARIGNERAIELLREQSKDQEASWVIENLEYSGAAALRVLEPYLDDHDPYVRRRAVWKIEELGSTEVIPLLERKRNDPDPWMRADVDAALRRMDLLLLEDSFLDWMAEKTGEGMGRIQRRGTDAVFSALEWVHWLGLGISVLVGLLLLGGWLRAFEPFKFALVIQFLIVEGVVGDLFLMNTSTELYRWATAGRLILLLGLLFLRDDPLPGETRGRVERIVVRSLWVLVPLILFLGAPVFATALRLSLRGFDFMKWALLLLAGISIFILEQAFVPWNLFARGGRAERALTFLLSSAVTGLFAVALWRWAIAAADDNRVTLSGLLLAPLVAALVFHLKKSRFLAPRGSPLRRSTPPPGRIRIVADGESLLIRLRERTRLRGLPLLFFGLAFVGIAWWMHTSLKVAQGAGPAMFLMMVLAVLGTAMCSLVFSGFSGLTVQVRDGAVRSASTFLGGAFGTTVWHRTLRVPAFIGRIDLTPAEKRWLAGILGGRTKGTLPKLELTLEVPGERPENGLPIPMELRVRNAGVAPVRLVDVESAYDSPWTAQVNGRRGDVYFSREEREAVVEPGTTRTFKPRLYGVAGVGPIVLRCGEGGPFVQCP